MTTRARPEGEDLHPSDEGRENPWELRRELVPREFLDVCASRSHTFLYVPMVDLRENFEMVDLRLEASNSSMFFWEVRYCLVRLFKTLVQGFWAT